MVEPDHVVPVAPMSGQDRGVRWLFTGRSGGVSEGPYASLNLADRVGDAPEAVAENRRRAAEVIGAERLVVMRACHGTTASVVGSDDDPVVDDVDILLTAEPGVAVAALAADCLPVLLYDAGSGIVGAVHSGWVGVRDDAVGAAVARLADLGARDLAAIIGPAVCGGCYPVPQGRVDEVADVVPEAAARTADGRPSLDLRRGVAARLSRAGVRVADVGVCTVESAGQFSYRRAAVTGRHGGIVMVERG